MLATSTQNTLFWSKHSEILQTTNSDNVDFTCSLVESSRHCQKGNDIFDLQSPRRWLEYCEVEDGRDGAYTVLRCDFHPSSGLWNIWGLPFHMDRLLSSFRSIQEQPTSEKEPLGATNATNAIMDTLLEDAGNSSFAVGDGVITLMLTILWVPSDQGIKVRGHAFHSGQLSIPNEYNPEPLTASISRMQNYDGENNAHPPLPNRYMNSPQAKLSSWCRRRSPLEEEFKTQGVGEVLLTRELGNDLELLEGLTSNLFIVYEDGSLRTPAADDSVLGGYARQLVLDHAEECGLRIQVGPLLLSETPQWKEVFTTSAIRLISPVSKIVTVQKMGDNDSSQSLEIMWTKKTETPFWRRIYLNILARGQKM